MASLLLLPSDYGLAQQPTKTDAGSAAAAGQMADIFGKVGDQIYEDCIFELSQEQIEVQYALIQAYMQQGASGSTARRLAATQIQPPKLSEKCEQIRRSPEALPSNWATTLAVPKKPSIEVAPKLAPLRPAPVIALTGKKVLPQWDCAPGVDYVTIHLKGYERKLTGGEICNPYDDVVRECPPPCEASASDTRSRPAALFIIADDPQVNGHTIAWAISGRDVCRNNPDPDCLAARAIGPLPPGEYSFAADKSNGSAGDRKPSGWSPAST